MANQNRATAGRLPGAAGPVAAASFSAGDRLPAPEAITRIMLRPLASSLPLGFFAFGTGSILLTALELHWVPVSQAPAVMMLILAFVVPLELLAGVFAFLARDSGAATALALLGTAWAGVSVTALEGDLGHQIEHAEREPGVRRQL